MNPLFTIRIAWRALLRNRMRSLLTMLGIIIGVGAVISMLSIGEGAQYAMKTQIEQMGTNTLEIYPGRRKGRSRGSDAGQRQLVPADWFAVAGLPQIEASSPMVWAYGSIVHFQSNWNCEINGVNSEYAIVTSWPLASGRMFNEAEVRASHNVAVLGKQVKEELFGAVDPVGETIRIENFPFKVVGVLSEKGSNGWSSEDNRVLVPYTTVMGKLSGSNRLGSLIFKAHSPDDVNELEIVVKDVLNRKYQIEDPELEGFRSSNSAEAIETAAASARIFSLLLGGVASVSLLVGGIGIMNIMLVSVTERTREIGIRMAVGARGRDILSQFLVESIVLSLVGGALGILLGIAIAIGIAHLAEWPPTVSRTSIMLAVGTSASIGVFFGFYPALSASRLDPIEALRTE